MKIILTNLLVLFASTAVGQFSRSFNLDEAPASNVVNTVSLQTINGQLNFFDIKSSVDGQLNIVTGVLDDVGETSEYKIISSTLPSSSSYSLSGTAITTDNEVVLAILFGTDPTKIAYIKISLLSQSVVASYFPTEQYQRGFVRSQQKEDSLISYIGIPGGGITRLAHSINNLGTYSTGIIDTTLTYSGSNKMIELLINGEQEYSVCKNKLFKRKANGSIISTSIGASTASPALVLNDMDNLAIFNGHKYYSFSSNLDSLTAGTIPVSLQGPTSNIEAIFTNSHYVVYINGKRIVLDTDFNLLNAKEYLRLNQSGVFKDANSFYVFGQRKDKTQDIGPKGSVKSNQALTVVMKDNGSLEGDDLLEYSQSIKHTSYKAKVNHLNSLFMDLNNVTAGLTYEKSSKTHSLIFSAQNSISGLNKLNETIGLSASLFNNSGLLPGPSTTTNLNNQANVDKYNRGYYVSRALIEEHIQKTTNQDPTYKVPFGIREWPAHGNTSIGQPEQIAHFYDPNNNSLYEPNLGEYPLIYGDQCVLTVFHQPDAISYMPHIESHQYVYTFDCDTSAVLQNTIFVKQLYLSRNENLDSVYLGSFSDLDIGNYNDDYVGSNVSLNLIYGYNGDSFDADDGGSAGFGDTIPAVGIQLLKGIKQYADDTDNAVGIKTHESINGFGFGDGIVDNEYLGLTASRNFTGQSNYPYSDPQSQSQYYNILQGNLQDGSPNTYGGIVIKHDYFGESDPQFYTSNGVDHGNNYSEITESNPAGDRRIIGGSGPGRLHTTDTVEISLAYMIAFDTVQISPTHSVNKLFEYGTKLKLMVKNNDAGCGNLFNPYVSENNVGIKKVNATADLRIFPNPFNNHITISGLEGDSEVRILDLNGRLILQENNTGDHVKLDLSMLDPAIYLVHVNSNNKRWVYKVIKQ
jgi:hypothetical protein